MKKYLIACGLFAAGMALCLAICSVLNGVTPVLSNESAIPSDIVNTHYALTGYAYDREQSGYAICLDALQIAEPLALVFSARPTALYQNGRMIYAFDQESPYARTITLPIQPEAETGKLDLLLTQRPSGPDIPSLFRSAGENTPKILIGTLSNIRQSVQRASDLTMVFVGIYAMISFSGLVLFLRKRTERDLCYLSAVACINLITTLITTGSSFIRISYGTYLNLRPLLFIVPVTLNVAICLQIYAGSIPDIWKKIISPAGILSLALIAILVQSTTRFITYHLIRRLFWAPVLITFANAIEKRQKNSVFLLLSYAVSEAIAVYLYQITLVGQASSFSIYMRLTELSNMIFMLSCILIAYDRFAGKFMEAESLFTQVRALNARLEEKVAERTKELRDEQEQKHNMMLNIFHDLRSPIFICRQRMKMLRSGNEDPCEAIDVVDERLSYMEKLTEELFLHAKLESKGVLFDEDFADLNAILARLVRDHTPSAEKQGIRISFHSGEPLRTWGDAYRLEQAFQNLIVNALQYTPSGGSITVTLESEGNLCRVSVADTGKGISPEDLPKVFDRYYRTNHYDRRSSGLGLSIAKEIILAHHGLITVRSLIGKGSVFVVTLPIIR